jgi:hypothetical protein
VENSGESSWGKRLTVGCSVLLIAAAAQAQTDPNAKTSSAKSRSDPSPTRSAVSPRPKAATSAHRTSGRSKKSRQTSSGKRGQQKIDAERARQIQEALIREHYLTGSASGTWDDATQKAMQHYQADHGWQSRTTPDARALIKLGLGPDREQLLNPDSVMKTPPAKHAVVGVPPPAAPAASAPAGSRPAAATPAAEVPDPASGSDEPRRQR